MIFVLTLFVSSAIGCPCEAQAPEERPLNTTRVHWVHVPKTGTSFVHAIHYVGCRNVYQHPSAVFNQVQQKDCKPGFDRVEPGHDPLRVTRKHGNAVTMVREPIARIASGFVHLMHDCWRMQRQYNCYENHENRRLECMRQIIGPLDGNGSIPEEKRPIVRRYAQCVDGCTVRLLNGRFCYAGDRPSQTEVKRAIELISDGTFAFVGLFEAWNQTVCRFLRRFGTTPPPCDHYLWKNIHKTPDEVGHYETAVARMLRDEGWDDADEPLYQEAKRLFFGAKVNSIL